PATADVDTPGLVDRLRFGYASGDVDLLDGLLHDDITVTMPPLPFSFEGRSAVGGVLTHVFATANPRGRGLRRSVPLRANCQDGFAVYVQPETEAEFHGHELVVVRTEGGRIVELTLFEPHLFPTFG